MKNIIKKIKKGMGHTKHMKKWKTNFI